MVLSEKFASDPIIFDNETNKATLAQVITRSKNRFHVIDSNLQFTLDTNSEAQFLNVAISCDEEVVFLTGTKVLSDEHSSHTIVNMLEICQ
jgi:hypothetical protein